MQCCCEGMWLFPTEYDMLVKGNVAAFQGIWCVVVRECGFFPRNMVCCCEAMWLFPKAFGVFLLGHVAVSISKIMWCCCEGMWLCPKEYGVML